jgi:predicted transcriptional regulator
MQDSSSSGDLRHGVQLRRRLPPRLREVADIVWERGEVSASEVCHALSEPLSNSAVRSMLRRLEAKGILRSHAEHNRYVYKPVSVDQGLRHRAILNFTNEYYEGSLERLHQEVQSLLGGSHDPD